MNAVPPQNVLLVRIIPRNVLVGRLQNILKKFLWSALQTIQVYCFWTHIDTYKNKFAMCLHALLYTTDLYRMTLDRDGSALLFVSYVVTIFMVFDVKYLSGTMFLMTFLSTFLELYDDFLKSIKEKVYFDTLLTFFTNLKQASFSSDIAFIAMYAYNSNLQVNKTVEDSLLNLIYACHLLIFNYKVFNESSLYLLTALTAIYVYLKSLRCARTRNIFGITRILI